MRCEKRSRAPIVSGAVPCKRRLAFELILDGEAYALTPELGQTPAATLCQSPYAIQNNLLQVAENAATSLPALPLWCLRYSRALPMHPMNSQTEVMHENAAP
ncbi:hypothetical protein FHX09_001320 [Rhizobium sp. BK538]|nr:hypothetical protein [Rhizobium sp. BK538]